MSEWIDCVVDNDYEININYPHQIRKKANGKIISESLSNKGYYHLKLNNIDYTKHRLIALQFIPNPENLPLIDHKNKIRIDNHIGNLCWCDYSTNNRNKLSNCGIKYNIISYDDCPDDIIEVNRYNQHEFENYYYSPENNKFYFDSGIDLRELYINIDKRNGSSYVWMMSVEKKQVKIYFTKFKRLYGFTF